MFDLYKPNLTILTNLMIFLPLSSLICNSYPSRYFFNPLTSESYPVEYDAIWVCLLASLLVSLDCPSIPTQSKTEEFNFLVAMFFLVDVYFFQFILLLGVTVYVGFSFPVLHSCNLRPGLLARSEAQHPESTNGHRAEVV